MDEQELKQTIKTTDPQPAVEFIVHDDEPDLVGQVISERYKIISEIGSGGMGKVYKAEHILLNKIQAVKVLHRHLTGEAQSLQRFQIEAKAASSLRHDNLLAVTDYGVTDSRAPYIVMDYVEGESLAHYLEQHGKLSVPDFLTVFSQVLKGLAHAHAKGVIHRDLKPSNIMISFNREGCIASVRIVDFGIAKILPNDQGAAQHLTQTGEIFGSPLYMSPEQCRGGKIDFRADVYSMGCVMFEALTGEVPVRGDNAVATLYKHMSETAPKISQTYPHLKIPTSIETIVAKCMANDPDQRYQTASQLSEDLAAVKADDAFIAAKPAAKKKSINLESGPGRKVIFLSTPMLIGLATVVLLLGAIFAPTFMADQAARQVQAGKNEAAATFGQAEEHYERATTAYFAKQLDEARSEAEKAWNLARELDPHSELCANSCNLVGIVDLDKLQELKQPAPLLEDEAERFLKQAVDLAPKRALGQFVTGKMRFKRDLANFYIYEKKWDLANAQLNDVLTASGKSLDELKQQGTDADLLRQFIQLYWGQGGRDLEAARRTIALSMPDSTPNLTPALNSDFAGNWVYSQSGAQVNGTNLQDYTFSLDATNDGPDQLTAKIQNFTADGKLGGSFQATGTAKNAIGDVSWQFGGIGFRAKLYRVGDYMLWRVTEPADSAKDWPVEVLSRTAQASTTKPTTKPDSNSAGPTTSGGVENATPDDTKSDESTDAHATPMLLNPAEK